MTRPLASTSTSTSTPPWTARKLALHTLLDVERRSSFADEAFDAFSSKARLSPDDQALAFEMVYGVLRHRSTLDWRLNGVMTRPLHRFPLNIITILRMGAYQLLKLDRIPEPAAVNESVNLAKTLKGRDLSGLVNGVLRALIRQPAPPWPKVVDDPVHALSIHHSMPTWLTTRWIDRLGLRNAEEACRRTVSIPPLTLRTNTLQCTREQLQERLFELGHTVTRTPVSPVGLTITKCGPLSSLEPLQEGWCYIEDEAAQLVPLLMDVHPGQRVLDACAAPGGKATHLAALMNNQGQVWAVDQNPIRLKRLEQNAQRLGISIITPVQCTINSSFPSLDDLSSWCREGFDRILVDAPCSGLGVLRRHPEAKWQKTADHFEQRHQEQLGMLNRVCTLLRPGGVLVYSACSTEPEETTQVISKFCHDHPDFLHESSTSWIPTAGQSLVDSTGDVSTMASGHDMDGFFSARLKLPT